MNLGTLSRDQLLARAKAKAELLLREDRAACAESLTEFIKRSWAIVEPSAPYYHNWHVDFIAAHLEAMARGEEVDGEPYNRLLINVPPGMMKSLLVNVFFPAWIWGPQDQASIRFLAASHSQELAIRDGLRLRRLIESDWYQTRWPHVKLTKDQANKLKFENTATGFRQAVAAGSITGVRADYVLIDDPNSVESASSDQMRASTNEWFTEAVPTRLNDPKKSKIIVIMQRLHEEDVSGVILDRNLGYDHIMLPMEFDPSRLMPTKLGLVDPRTEPGELLFPDRFPFDVVERDKRIMGPYATAGQFDQAPTPRGGGVIKQEWWQVWEEANFPPFDYIVAALDTAYTEKQENDPSAMTVWGVWSGGLTAQQAPTKALIGGRMETLDRAYTQDHPRVMLVYAWAERLEFHDLIQKVRETMVAYKVDRLLVENKAAGHSVVQELRRMFGYNDMVVQSVEPKGIDKLSRIYAVQHLFAEGLIFAPDRGWADMVINQLAQFPKGKHDDLADTCAYALKWLRDAGMLKRNDEWTAEQSSIMTHRGAGPAPLYPV